jgi:hypothetical protein
MLFGRYKTSENKENRKFQGRFEMKKGNFRGEFTKKHGNIPAPN